MARKDFKLAGHTIAQGEEKEVKLKVAQLPSRLPVEIAVTVYHAENDGPVLLLTGGLHGDEINGIETVRRIIARKQHYCNAGTVVCISVVNVYGFINYSRDLPDGKDINRSFPGSKDGSLASRIAYALMTEIVPYIDYGIDFHSGGGNRTNYPQIRCSTSEKDCIELASAFDPPFIIDAPFRKNSFRKSALEEGKPILVYEGGESSRLNATAISEGIKGTRRVMKHLGMINEAPESKHEMITLSGYKWLRAPRSGIFMPKAVSGEYIEKGQKIGVVSCPFGHERKTIKSPKYGYVIGVNNSPVVSSGDALFNIGTE